MGWKTRTAFMQRRKPLFPKATAIAPTVSQINASVAARLFFGGGARRKGADTSHRGPEFLIYDLII